MPKKGKKGEKEAKQRKKLSTNEQETVSYEQQIIDNNKQIARLRLRNEELENDIEQLQQKLQNLEEDRADVVAHLERVLREKTEEAHELAERLAALEDLRKEEQAAFKKREDALELDYYNMENTLTAEIKLAAGKLNALEDWKNSRIELMRKFEIQEAEMAAQEERHKKMLYEAEKALIVGKAKMKKEMEERLMELADKFKDATNIRIADATHRAIRENIALNKELDLMFRVSRNLDDTTKQCKERQRMLKLQAALFESEAKMALNKTLKQNQVIEKLAEEHFNMKVQLGRLKRVEANVHAMEQLAESYRDKCRNITDEVKHLEERTQRAKSNEDKIMNDVAANCQEIERLARILREARQCVAEALELQEGIVDEDICTVCYPNLKEKLLYNLRDILGREHAVPDTTSNLPLQMSPMPESHYKPGDLGLVPTRR